MFFRAERPPSYWDVIGHHLPFALVTGMALAVTRFVPLEKMPLIPCYFLRITGYPCPFCGMTRAFAAMGQGAWTAAFHESPMGAVLYLATAAVFVWNAGCLISGRRIECGSSHRTAVFRGRWWIMILAGLLLANWIYRLVAGLK